MKYFTADTHFGHKNYAHLRDRHIFETLEEHDERLIKNINEFVRPEDELFILGDFAFEKPGRYRPRLNCKTVYFVLGNHDRKEKSKHTFGEIPHMRFTKLTGATGEQLPVVLSHYPQIYWSGSHNGHAHLYGHCHGTREITLDTLFPKRRSMDVGVDSALDQFGRYVPFSEHWLFDRLIAKPGHDDPSYYDGDDE